MKRRTGERGLEKATLAALCLLGLLLTPVNPPFASEFPEQDRRVQPRFQAPVELEGEAILDTHTGLIWEQSPTPRPTEWYRAKSDCGVKVVGGHRGWRLPSFFELMTLVEPSPSGRTGALLLPAGHPFTRLPGEVFWSSDTMDQNLSHAYVVDFLAGDVALRVKTSVAGLWCVKGVHTHPVVPKPDRQLIDWFPPRSSASPLPALQ